MKKSTSYEKSGTIKCTFGEKDCLEFIEAVKKDHESEVSSLIDVGVDVNITDESGRNGLTYAITNGSKSMVDLLIKAGADVNAIHDNYGQTPLSDAAANGDESIVSTLIGAGADVNKTNKNTARTALFNAVEKNRYSVVDVLINAGSEVNIRDGWGETPLFNAVDDEKMVHKLICAGIDVNIINKYSGKTAIFNAVIKDCENVVYALIEADADVNITDIEGRTALFDAVKYAEKSSQMIESCTEVNTADDDVENIHLINERMALALIKANADVNIADKSGQTLLFGAVKNDNEKVALALLDHGADVNFAKKDGETVLFGAVSNNNENLALAFLDHGADVNLATEDGATVFDAAVLNNNKKLASAFLDAGIDVNARDVWGTTALFRAVINENEDITHLLVNAGADVNFTDIMGRTPLFYAVRNGYESITCSLIEAGADVNKTDELGKTPLFYAVESDDDEDDVGYLTFFKEDILHTLIKECNVFVNKKDVYGRTPLFYAIAKSPSAALYLLENGGNINLKDNCNMSILSYFVEQQFGKHRLPIFSTSLFSKSEAFNLLMQQGVKHECFAEAIMNVVFCIIPLACNIVLDQMLYLSSYGLPHFDITLINRTNLSNALTVVHDLFYETDDKKKIMIKDILEVLREDDNNYEVPRVLDSLIELGAKPNSVDSHGNTALHHVTLLPFYGKAQTTVINICCQLEKCGVNFNAKNQQNENPVLYCLSYFTHSHGKNILLSVIKAMVEVCRFILQRGASVDDVSKKGKSVLHLNFKIFEACLKIIHKARRQDVLQEIMKLLQSFLQASPKKEVLVNKSDDNLNSPLHLWASLEFMTELYGYNTGMTRDCESEEFIRDIFKLLLEGGAKLNPRNISDKTPLHLCRTWSAVKLLLDAGANPNDVDSSGNTPLLASAKNTKFEEKNCFYPDVTEDSKTFWKTAIEKQLDPWAVNKQGESVLSILTASEEFVLAKALIEAACEENYVQSDTVAVSLLNALCQDKSKRTHWKGILVETILKSRKGQANLPGPLHLCCRNILEFGMFEEEQRETDVTPQLEQGKSSLSENHASCDDKEQPPSKKRKTNERETSAEETSAEFKNKQAKYNSVHCEIAKQLIHYGADCRSPDSSGKSCLDIAEGNPALIDFLTRPIRIDEVPIVIPWTSVSKKFEAILAKVARRQECKFVNTLWHHKDHIGSGSFGHIFAGINEKDGREVAIKRIEKVRMQRPEDKREIENLLIVADSENIVRYLSFFEDENFSYLVLELMEGDLDSYLQDRALYPRDDVQLCKDVLVGLRYLHEQNVIHRDLKPSNILYKTHPKLCLKIADFGLSRRIDSISTTVYGTNVGTRCWIAPEVLKSTKDHSISSDIFACGLVLHYIFSVGKHPFSPASCAKKSDLGINNETEANVLNDRMEGWDNSLSPEATHLVKKMLENDASKPRPTAAEALDHPLFWSKKKKIDFLTAVGNQPEFECPRAKRGHPLTAVETDLDKVFSTVVKYATWIDSRYIHMPAIYTEMTKKRKSYDTKSLAELVRFIRNAYAHVSDIKRPTAIRKYILEDFVFLDYFPNLVIEVFKSVTSHGWDQTRDEIKCKMNK